MKQTFKLIAGVDYSYSLPKSYPYADQGITVDLNKGDASFLSYEDYEFTVDGSQTAFLDSSSFLVTITLEDSEGDKSEEMPIEIFIYQPKTEQEVLSDELTADED